MDSNWSKLFQKALNGSKGVQMGPLGSKIGVQNYHELNQMAFKPRSPLSCYLLMFYSHNCFSFPVFWIKGQEYITKKNDSKKFKGMIGEAQIPKLILFKLNLLSSVIFLFFFYLKKLLCVSWFNIKEPMENI